MARVIEQQEAARRLGVTARAMATIDHNSRQSDPGSPSIDDVASDSFDRYDTPYPTPLLQR